MRPFLLLALLLATPVCAAAVPPGALPLVASAIAPPTSPAPSLRELFSAKMIGARVAEFEAKAGPAVSEEKGVRHYKVGSCSLTATVASEKITALSLQLSPECSVRLPLLAGLDQPLHLVTFGQLESARGQGSMKADCLKQCGNTYDSHVFAYWPSTTDDLEVMVGVKIASDATWVAYQAWVDMMYGEGESYITEATFNCHERYGFSARNAFKDIAIDQVTIGRALATPQCLGEVPSSDPRFQ